MTAKSNVFAKSATRTSPDRENEMTLGIQERYQNDIRPSLVDDLQLDNIMQVPRLDKVVLNIGMGEARENPKAIEAAVRDLGIITGQQPVVTKARKSIANFKLREGVSIGTKVTLRGEKMWAFLDRLINVALPRVRDFRGISPNSFDGRGNYTLGLQEQLIFPEIQYDKIDRIRGMEITIVTTAETDEQARRMLELVGMPFRKEG
jgi:large subunit ribosomal protein L5